MLKNQPLKIGKGINFYLVQWPNGDLTVLGASSDVELWDKLDMEGGPADALVVKLTNRSHVEICKNREGEIVVNNLDFDDKNLEVPCECGKDLGNCVCVSEGLNWKTVTFGVKEFAQMHGLSGRP